MVRDSTGTISLFFPGAPMKHPHRANAHQPHDLLLRFFCVRDGGRLMILLGVAIAGCTSGSGTSPASSGGARGAAGSGGASATGSGGAPGESGGAGVHSSGGGPGTGGLAIPGSGGFAGLPGGGTGGPTAGGGGGTSTSAGGGGGGLAAGGGSGVTPFLTETFESGTVGQQPAGWDNFIGYVKNAMNPQGDTLALIDSTHAHGGKNAVHFRGGSGPVMLTRPLPAGTNRLFVRAYFYMSRQLGMNRS